MLPNDAGEIQTEEVSSLLAKDICIIFDNKDGPTYAVSFLMTRALSHLSKMTPSLPFRFPRP